MSEINYEHNLIQDPDIFSLYTGENNKYFQNREAVERLKNECDLLAEGTVIGTAIRSWTALLALVPTSIPFAVLAEMTLTAEYLTRVHRLYSVAKMLLDHFGDDGITITLRVKTSSTVIDLLVRMPDKRIFALAIRGSENTSVRWHENHQQFYVKKQGKKAKKSEPFTRTIGKLNTIIDLKKEKSPLMGTSSSERNAPIIKAIVLAPGAKIAANSQQLRTEFGAASVLKIKTTSTTYVVEYDELTNFLLIPKKIV
jgi:hypothetical protein